MNTNLTEDDIRYFLSADERDERFLRIAGIVNAAIAEWLGWTFNLIEGYKCWRSPTGDATSSDPPNHVLGLEALGNLHRALLKLTEEQLRQFHHALCKLIGCAWYQGFLTQRASSRQRAIALFLVISSNSPA